MARSGLAAIPAVALLGLLTPGNIPYARILGGWFERRRGAAYGILGLGFGVGGPLALYLGSACIDAFGWRATFLVYGLLEGLLALPLLYALFASDRRPAAGAAPASRRAARSDARPGLALGGLLADRRQPDPRRVRRHWRDGAWRAAVAGARPVAGSRHRRAGGAVGRHDRFATGAGLPAGPLRHPAHRLAVRLLAALGLLLLLLGGPPALLWGAVFLIGLGAGGETGTTQYFVSRYFGLRHFSVIYGSIQPFTFAIAISLGAWLLGYFYDRAGSYAGSTLVLLGAFGVAAGLLVMLGRYRYAIDGEARSHGRD
nr:MFS transporter [Pseudomonas aeruginosa]